ncbi:MAG: multidrug ABC transporter ATP-binding protein [Planctomyces sp.]|nr:multidrug ABC transporter ATP-binding protein [Planctomyces sp.]MBA4119551.1 multidrug ABC transporter ATP-binding protein [Isosphaera sp.]
MIETINLTKRYGDLVALDSLNLTINQGDCFGFIGPNGAGKTTTIKILATLLKPSSGQAMIDGLTVGYQNRQIRPLIGYVPDFMGAYQDMVVTEYLQFFAACYNIVGQERQRVVGDVLELTDLTDKSDAEVNALSRGMQQRLSVARVLLHDPKVLLMDEPASGLDPRARIEMRELLKELKRMGKTIIISSHILPELAEMCNVVGIIERGQLLFAGTVQEALRRAKVGHVVHVAVTARAQEAAEVLAKVPGVARVTITEGAGPAVNGAAGVGGGSGGGGGSPLVVVSLDPGARVDVSDIPNILINRGFRLTQFSEEDVNLETAFMRLTKGMVQ